MAEKRNTRQRCRRANPIGREERKGRGRGGVARDWIGSSLEWNQSVGEAKCRIESGTEFFFLPGSTEFQQPLVVSAVVLAYVRFYWVLPSFTRFQTVFSDFFWDRTQPCSFQINFQCNDGVYWVVLGFYRVSTTDIELSALMAWFVGNLATTTKKKWKQKKKRLDFLVSE